MINVAHKLNYAAWQPACISQCVWGMCAHWHVHKNTVRHVYNAFTLNWVVEHDVLFGQFQQHGVVKELIDGDIFTEALSGRRGKEEVEGATIRLGPWMNRVWLVTKCKEGLLGVRPTKLATCPECACLTHYKTHSNTA